MQIRSLVCCAAVLGASGAALVGAPAPVAAQNLDITTLKPEQLEKRIRAAGWHVVAPPITTDMPEYRSWIWAITQGQAGGAVGLYIYKDVNAARTLVDILTPNKDTEVVRNRNVVVSVIMTGRPREARDLMGLLTGATRLDSPPRPLVDSNNGDDSGTEHSSVTSEGTSLPELRYGHLWRAEVLNAVLAEGWSLAGPPTVSNDEGYAAVSYRLQGNDAALVLSLYGCSDTPCVKEVEASARRTAGAVSARRGNTVLVLLAPDHPTEAKRALARIHARP